MTLLTLSIQSMTSYPRGGDRVPYCKTSIKLLNNAAWGWSLCNNLNSASITVIFLPVLLWGLCMYYVMGYVQHMLCNSWYCYGWGCIVCCHCDCQGIQDAPQSPRQNSLSGTIKFIVSYIPEKYNLSKNQRSKAYLWRCLLYHSWEGQECQTGWRLCVRSQTTSHGRVGMPSDGAFLMSLSKDASAVLGTMKLQNCNPERKVMFCQPTDTSRTLVECGDPCTVGTQVTWCDFAHHDIGTTNLQGRSLIANVKDLGRIPILPLTPSP